MYRGMYDIGGHQMSESNCQCGRTHAKGCRCSCGGHENVCGEKARIEYRDGTVEVAKVVHKFLDIEYDHWTDAEPHVEIGGKIVVSSRELVSGWDLTEEIAKRINNALSPILKAEYERGQREMRERVKEIEQRTRPDGDMADLAVNRLAQSILGEVKS